jgi:HEAT repeat protein
MQEGAADAAPILLRDLIDPVLFKDDKPLHDRVKQAIVKIGRPAVKPLLKIASQDPLALNRFRAVQVIGEMGADVKDLAQNPLRRIQQRDTSLSVRAEAEAVLKKYGEAPR